MSSPSGRGFHTPALVSVVTPCYNAAPFVAETIASVQAQTYPSIQHIVVDDGSTDGSWDEIVRHPEVKAVRLAGNHGGSYARNRGVEASAGEYLMFLDADDVLRPDAIEALVAAVRERPGTAAVCPWVRLVERRTSQWEREASEIPYPPPQDALYGWLMGIWVPPCAVLWRRDVYETTGGWDEALTLNDDGDLMMRAIARGLRLVPADGGESWYRSHGTSRLSLSNDLFQRRRLYSQRRVLDKLEAELTRLGRLQAYATPLGRAYRRLGLVAYRHGEIEFGRECTGIGARLAGGVAVSRTAPGRMLERLLGPEMKERVASGLAKVGVGTSLRRMHLVMLDRFGESAPGPVEER